MWTYDDWGGWYDHVKPPRSTSAATASACRRCSSARTPSAATSTAPTLDFTSILKFIEENWGLRPLATRRREANSFMSAFDFTNGPRQPASWTRSAPDDPRRAEARVIYVGYYGAALRSPARCSARVPADAPARGGRLRSAVPARRRWSALASAPVSCGAAVPRRRDRGDGPSTPSRAWRGVAVGQTARRTTNRSGATSTPNGSVCATGSSCATRGSDRAPAQRSRAGTAARRQVGEASPLSTSGSVRPLVVRRSRTSGPARERVTSGRPEGKHGRVRVRTLRLRAPALAPGEPRGLDANRAAAEEPLLHGREGHRRRGERRQPRASSASPEPYRQKQIAVKLLFYRPRFSAHDALFGSRSGSGVKLTYPERPRAALRPRPGRRAHGRTPPRGEYWVEVDGPGMSFVRPVTLSRTNRCRSRSLSWLDIAFVVGVPVRDRARPLARRAGRGCCATCG